MDQQEPQDPLEQQVLQELQDLLEPQAMIQRWLARLDHLVLKEQLDYRERLELIQLSLDLVELLAQQEQ